MIIHVSKYFTLANNSEKNLVELKWLPESLKMNDEEYRQCGIAFKSAIGHYSPVAILSDNRDFQFSITPDLQEWTNQEIFPVLLGKGVRRFALLVSPNLFSQISVEQLMEENVALNFTKRYFERREEALIWLLAKE